MVDVVAADSHSSGQQYLVVGKSGPGIGTPEEGLALLQNLVLPTLDQLAATERATVAHLKGMMGK